MNKGFHLSALWSFGILSPRRYVLTIKTPVVKRKLGFHEVMSEGNVREKLHLKKLGKLMSEIVLSISYTN